MEKKKHKAPAAAAKPAPVIHKINHHLLAFICTLVALTVYANTINHEYVVDDDQVLAKNKITKQGISAIPTIFKTAYRAGFWERKEGVYRPLSVVLFAIEWQFFPNNPTFGHLINILLYALTAFLLYRLLRNTLHKHHPLIPFFITLLYIVMPIHTEVVANVKSCDELLCFLFAIVSLQQLYNWIVSKKVYALIFALLSFFLALLSKESAITLVAVYPLFVYYFSSEKTNKIIVVSLSFLSVAIVFLAIRYSVLGMMTGNADIPLINNSLVGTTDRMLQFSTAVSIMGKYLWLMIAPVTLVFDYSYNTIPLVSLASFKSFLPFIIYVALIVFAIREFRKKNPVSFGILFFIITISIVSNILFLIESTMAERFVYMPSLGFCIAIVFTMMKAVKIKPKSTESIYKQTFYNPVILVFFACIIIYSGRTIARNMDWKTNLILVEKDMKSSPESSRLYFSYGGGLLFEHALVEKDKVKKRELTIKAKNALEKGVALIQGYSTAWYHLGVAYKQLDDNESARVAFHNCKRSAFVNEAEGYIAEGLALAIENKFDSAIINMNKALELDSVGAAEEALSDLGTYYSNLGKISESLEAFNKLIILKPKAPLPYYNLGNTYAKIGDYKTAQNYYRRAIGINPAYVDAMNNMGNCYSAMKMPDSAKVYYQMAVDTDPNDVNSLKNMGVFYREAGDLAQSEIYFRKAQELIMK